MTLFLPTSPPSFNKNMVATFGLSFWLFFLPDAITVSARLIERDSDSPAEWLKTSETFINGLEPAADGIGNFAEDLISHLFPPNPIPSFSAEPANTYHLTTDNNIPQSINPSTPPSSETTDDCPIDDNGEDSNDCGPRIDYII